MLTQDSAYASNCELVLIGKNGDIPTKEAYEEFYKLIVTYRYPMRYLKLNQQAIEALSHDERKLLESDEFAFIEQKFKKIYPDYQIEAVPKSLYQLHGYAENIKDQVENRKGKKATNEETPLNFNWEEERQNDEHYEDYCSRILHQDTSHHYYINQQFLQRRLDVKNKFVDKKPHEDEVVHEYLLNIKQDLQNLNQNDHEIVMKMLRGNRNLDKSFIFLKMLNLDLNLNSKSQDEDDSLKFMNFAEDMCLVEWDSRKKQNVHYVYQGMSVQIHNREERNMTFSYGDGFFGGGVTDAESAMAYSYVTGTKKATNFSITQVNKYLTEPENELIYIPRVTALINLHGSGEFHHARSKVKEGDFEGKVKEGDFEVSKIQKAGIAKGTGSKLVESNKDLLDFLYTRDKKITTTNEIERNLMKYQKEFSVELESKRHHAKDVFKYGSEQSHKDEVPKQVGYSLYKEKQLISNKKVKFSAVHAGLKSNQKLKSYQINKLDEKISNLTNEAERITFLYKKIENELNSCITQLTNLQQDLQSNNSNLQEVKQRFDKVNQSFEKTFSDELKKHNIPAISSESSAISAYEKEYEQLYNNFNTLVASVASSIKSAEQKESTKKKPSSL